MNTITNHQIGQATHREYESRYGGRYTGEEAQPETKKSAAKARLFLALSGFSITGLAAALVFLF